jgi:hypothetical protein
MAQTASRRPAILAEHVQHRISPGGICGGQSDAGKGFFWISSVLLSQYPSSNVTYSSSWQLSGRSQGKLGKNDILENPSESQGQRVVIQ